MEKDLKNDAQKMISYTTTDEKDDAVMNPGGTGSDSSTTDQKEASGGDDVAMNPGGAKMEKDHQKEGGDDAALIDFSVNITPNKRKLEWILAMGPSETKTSSKKRCGSPPPAIVHTIDLKAGEDMVDVIFELSKEYDHLRFVTVIAVTGSVSEVVILDPNGPPNTLKGAFEINSISVSLLADEDGRHCREKITAATLKKSAGESSADASALKCMKIEKVIEDLKSYTTISPAADGNINAPTKHLVFTPGRHGYAT